MNGRDISIAQRLIAGFGIVVLLLVVDLLYIKSLQDRSARAQTNLTERVRPRQLSAWQLERSLLYLGITVRDCLLVSDRPCDDRLATNIRDVRLSVSALNQLPKDPDGALLYAPIPSAVERFLSITDSIVGLRTRSFADAEIGLSSARESVLAQLRTYGALQISKADSATTEVTDARARVTSTLVISIVLCSVIAMLVGFLTIRSVQAPTRELVQVAAAIRKGDWAAALEWIRTSSGQAGLADIPEMFDDNAVRNEFRKIGNAFAVATVALDARERELLARSRVAISTASSLDVRDVAEQALAAIAEHMNADVGVVHLLNRDGRTLSPIAARAIDAGDTLSIGNGIPGLVALEGRTSLITDIPADTPFKVRLGFDEAPVSTVLSVPVQFGSTTIAVLTVGAIRTFTPEQQRFIESAATQLGIGLQNVRTYAELQNVLVQVTQQREHIQQQFELLQSQTEELQAQHEEIQAQNEELQAQSEEIQSQNAQLLIQTQTLTEADEQKNDFLGLLAHELRNPLAAVSNSVFLLSTVPNSSAVGTRACDIIDRQTRQLTRLIDDLLDITRVSRGKVNLELSDLDLSALVTDCVVDHRSAFERQLLSVKTVLPARPIYVHGDHTRLAQIVGNLLDNAIKFTEPGGSVFIQLIPADRLVQIRVKDSGIGVERDQLPRLFQPFVQVDPSRTRNAGGLGLGLALVDAFARLHGGTATAESNGQGAGTTFTVTLPMLLESEGVRLRQPPMTVTSSTDVRRLRILIIEDNRDAAESLRDVLLLDGHDVQVARHVLEGLRQMREFKPELVLCDVGLPDLDGYDLARRVRQDPALASTYLVALTGYAASNDRARSSAAGFNQHLSKPATVEAVRRVLWEVAQH